MMDKKNNSGIQLLILLLLVTVGLTLLSLSLGKVEAQPQAQSGLTCAELLHSVGLSGFGLDAAQIQAANILTADLSVASQTSSTAISGLKDITFTVTITNEGPNPAEYVLFCDIPPAHMNKSKYIFSAEVISNSTSSHLWLFPNPITVANTIDITITGQINYNAECSLNANYTAYANAFNTGVDPYPANNTSQLALQLVGSSECLYLPLISRKPTPTPIPPTPTPTPSEIYYDNFSDDDSGWAEGDDGDCDSNYEDNKYRLDVDKDEDCFRPGPGEAEEYHGYFSVEAKRIGGGDEYAYGLYINGKGGDNYYLFRVWPDDDCGWDFIRREDGDNDTIHNGGCDDAIKRDSDDTNILAIEHEDDIYSVYVNDERLASYEDDDPLNGDGVGVYAIADPDKDLTVEFDNFKILAR